VTELTLEAVENNIYYLYGTDADWTNARKTWDSTGSGKTILVQASSTTASVGFITFDLSLFNTVNDITSAELMLYCTSVSADFAGLKIYGFDGTELSTYSINEIGSTSFGAIADTAAIGFITVTINSTGIAYIKERIGSDFCCLCLVDDTNIASPTPSANSYISFGSPEYPVDMCVPQLTINTVPLASWNEGLALGPVREFIKGSTVRLDTYTYDKKGVAANPRQERRSG